MLNLFLTSVVQCSCPFSLYIAAFVSVNEKNGMAPVWWNVWSDQTDFIINNGFSPSVVCHQGAAVK